MSQSIISAKDIKIDKDGRCSLAHKSLRQIPFTVIGKKASQIVELDLSNNLLSELPHLDWFPNLKSLVVDNNRLQSNSNFNNGKPLPRLELLWVNGCQIKHLAVWIDKIAAVCPNLKMFSMLKNAACPNFFNGGTMQQYTDYRLFVLSRLRNLTVLDSTPVTNEEKEEALRQYGDLRIEPKLVQIRQSKKNRKKSSDTATTMTDVTNSPRFHLPEVSEMERSVSPDTVSSVLPNVQDLSKSKLPIDLPDPSQL
jgi:Leucine-rich repeat (LRR) protein